MKTAIVFYSMTGNVEYAAKKMAADIPADLIPITPEKAYPSSGVKKFLWGGKAALMGDMPTLVPYELDFDAYDRIVLGTPVWAGSFAPPIRSFVEENHDQMVTKRIAAFACSSSGNVGKTFDKLGNLLGMSSLETTLSLIDPKDRPKLSDNNEIRDFCSRLG